MMMMPDDYGDDDDVDGNEGICPALVMEFVEGQTLEKKIFTRESWK